MRRNYKKLAVVMAIMILVTSLGSAAFAAGTFKNLKAFFNNIKIYKNGTIVPMTAEPFIIDGTTYVPLRAVSEMLDKDVTWDQATYSIGINDKPGSSINDLYLQIYNYQLQISQLEKKVKDLEAQLGGKPSAITSISAMEKYLNNEYGTYKKIDFDFDLSESKSKITVKIYVDLDVDETRWDSLSTKDIETFLQNVVDDIYEAFPDKTASGFIEDSYYDEELISFSVSSKGKVSVSETSGGSGTLSSTQSYLNKNYDKLSYGSKGKSVSISDIRLYGDKYEIEVTIYADKDDFDMLYDNDYDDDIESYLEDLNNEILYDYPNAEVFGSIKDSKTILEFDFTSKGYANLYWK